MAQRPQNPSSDRNPGAQSQRQVPAQDPTAADFVAQRSEQLAAGRENLRPETSGSARVKRRKPSILLSLLGTCFSIVLVCVFAVAGWVVWAVHKPIDAGVELFEIEAGQNLSQFGRQLVRRNVVEETLSIRLWSKFTGTGQNIKIGRYQLSQERRVVDILDKIERGDVVTQQIVFIEGHSFREFRSRLADAADLEQTLAGVTDEEILNRLGAAEVHPEGLFFPDTYDYVSGSTDFEILQRSYKRMQEKLDEAWQQRQLDVPLQTPYEALILASIVEKETGAAEERPRIAGVFVNRLRQGMRLQTDPTVIYGLGNQFDGNLTRAHLRADTEYNTYTRAGLPPTPIANPGADALMAVAQPLATSELYFVSRGDGSHKFSDTLEQHNAAVDKYQRKKGGN